MSDFKGPELLKKTYDYFTSNIKNMYSDGMSLCICGSHGLGKSLTSSNILKFACLKGYSCLYSTCADIISALIEAPYEEKYDARKQLMMSDMIVIDELDSRHIGGGLSSDLWGRSVDNIFRCRQQNKLCTIFISNSPNVVEGFEGSIKESIASLMSRVKTIAVRGNDYRKIEQNQ